MKSLFIGIALLCTSFAFAAAHELVAEEYQRMPDAAAAMSSPNSQEKGAENSLPYSGIDVRQIPAALAQLRAISGLDESRQEKLERIISDSPRHEDLRRAVAAIHLQVR
jgi:hypothetical protein